MAPQLQRMKSEDLLASVFPDQVACAENLVGERELPDHPLVAQTLHDCLFEAMDAEGWLRLLRRLEAGEVTVVARDLPAPSPFAAEALNARPYAYLDDAPIEERRTQAVQNRRYADLENTDDMGRLDPDAIQSVREEAWPRPRSADEMAEGLISLGVISEEEVQPNTGWLAWLESLAQAGRATLLQLAADNAAHSGLWVAAEGLALAQALYPDAVMQPVITAPIEYPAAVQGRGESLHELLRSRLGGLGPVSADVLAMQLRLPLPEIETALLGLQSEGYVLQGRFSAGAPREEWCERHLLARIHRYTLKRLRREIEPVEPRDFARFLFDWQHVSASTRVSGPEALAGVLSQLEGYEAPAAIWEAELLPARVADYATVWLDELCTAGRILWTRLRPSLGDSRAGGGSQSLRSTPILLLPRRNAALWTRLAPAMADDTALSSRALRVAKYLVDNGASFFDEITDGTRMLRSELEDALSELVARGRASCDSYAGLRALLVPAAKRSSAHASRRRRVALHGIADAGRWSLTRQPVAASDARPGIPPESVEQVARILLRRYGVMCWNLFEREAAWLPPWRDLVRTYQRLEARGEIRGGRFIAGLSGEQFALPEAIGLMRQVRRQPPDNKLLCLAATDPANLLGTILAGPKVARVPGSRVLYRDGLPIATSVAGQVEMLAASSKDEQHAAAKALTLDPSLRFLEQLAENLP